MTLAVLDVGSSVKLLLVEEDKLVFVKNYEIDDKLIDELFSVLQPIDSLEIKVVITPILISKVSENDQVFGSFGQNPVSYLSTSKEDIRVLGTLARSVKAPAEFYCRVNLQEDSENSVIVLGEYLEGNVYISVYGKGVLQYLEVVKTPLAEERLRSISNDFGMNNIVKEFGVVGVGEFGSITNVPEKFSKFCGLLVHLQNARPSFVIERDTVKVETRQLEPEKELVEENPTVSVEVKTKLSLGGGKKTTRDKQRTVRNRSDKKNSGKTLNFTMSKKQQTIVKIALTISASLLFMTSSIFGVKLLFPKEKINPGYISLVSDVFNYLGPYTESLKNGKNHHSAIVSKVANLTFPVRVEVIEYFSNTVSVKLTTNTIENLQMLETQLATWYDTMDVLEKSSSNEGNSSDNYLVISIFLP